MIVKIKKEVEETLEVKIPFASKDMSHTWLVTDDCVICVLNSGSFISKTLKESEAYYQRYVTEAAGAEAISIEEAQGAIANIIKAYESLISLHVA